jgi:hypothetical protein
MVAGGYSFANSHHSRARKIMRSGANERGRRGDLIPYLTYRGGASWWPDFAGEEGGDGLLVLFLGGGTEQGRLGGEGAATGGRCSYRGKAGR